jgi:hypothetical protein
VFVDACRKKEESMLTASECNDIPSSVNLIVGFAAGSGKLAYEGLGDYSVFTDCLARALEACLPGELVSNVFSEARMQVISTSKEQTPTMSVSASLGNFALVSSLGNLVLDSPGGFSVKLGQVCSPLLEAYKGLVSRVPGCVVLGEEWV